MLAQAQRVPAAFSVFEHVTMVFLAKCQWRSLRRTPACVRSEQAAFVAVENLRHEESGFARLLAA